MLGTFCFGGVPEKNRRTRVDRSEKGECRRNLNWALKSHKRTGIGPENKKKERPREGRSYVNTGRDDKIRTCDPLLPKQKRSLGYALRSLCANVPESTSSRDVS